jgi:hypothetical protein
MVISPQNTVRMSIPSAFQNGTLKDFNPTI